MSSVENRVVPLLVVDNEVSVVKAMEQGGQNASGLQNTPEQNVPHHNVIKRGGWGVFRVLGISMLAVTMILVGGDCYYRYQLLNGSVNFHLFWFAIWFRFYSF